MRLKRNLITYAYGLALALSSLVTALPSNGETVTTTAAFDAASDFTAYGSAITNGTVDWNATAGKSSGGGLSVLRTASSGYFNGWHTTPINFTGKTALSTSLLIHGGAWNNSNTTYLGFVNNASAAPSGTSAFLTTGSYTSIYVMLEYSTSDSGRFRLRLYNKQTTGSTSSVGSEIELKNVTSAGIRNEWLRLKVDLIPHPTTANAYNAVATLERVGTSGTGTPTSVMSTGNNVITNASIFGATAAYPAFNYYINSNTAETRFDDHHVSVSAETPNAPVASAATVETTTRMTAKWTAATAGAMINGYSLELVKAEDEFTAGSFIAANGTTGQAAGIQLSPSTLSQAFQNLVRNQAYKYQVRAKNAAGAGIASNVIEFTTSNVNTPATLDAIPSQVPLYPGDVGPRIASLSGITHGGDDGQTVAVSVSSSNQSVVSDSGLLLNYTPGNATGTLTYTPTGTAGETVITVTVKDFTGGIEEGSFSRSFTLRVQQPPVNYGFNNESDLEDFGQASSALTSAWVANAGQGFPASGGITVSKSSGSSTGYANGWRKQTLNLVSKDLIRTSILVNLADFTPHASSASGIYLGFTTNGGAVPTLGTVSFMDSSTASTHRAVSTYLGFTSASNGTLSLQLKNKTTTSTASTSATAIPATAVDKNQWLRLTLDLSPSGAANTYFATTKVEALGVDGLGTPVLLTSTSALVTNADIFAATAAYPAYNVNFYGSSTVAGSMRLDDHEASVAVTAPVAPTALTASGITTTDLTANWSANPGAFANLGFLLKVVTDQAHFETGPYVQISGSTGSNPITILSNTATFQTLTGLARGTSYFYRIQARNSTGISPESNTLATATSSANIPPTLDPLTSPASIYPTTSPTPTTVSLTNISHGGDIGQTITVTVSSDDTSVVPTPLILYSSPNNIGNLVYTPTGVAGTANISVRVWDGEDELIRTFTVHVRTPPAKYDFNGEEEASSEYSYATTNNSSNISGAWASNAGTGSPAGGGITITKTGNSTLMLSGWRKQTFDLTNKTYTGSSIMINPREWQGRNNTLHVGFITSAAPTASSIFTASASRSYFGELIHEVSNNRFSIKLQNRITTTTATPGIIQYVTRANDLKSHWLRLSVDAIPTVVGGNLYMGTVRLEDLGPDGTSPVVLLAEYSAEFTNANLAAATEAYAAYEVVYGDGTGNTGKTYLDNHEAAATATVPAAPVSVDPDLLVKHAFTARWNRPSNSAVSGYILEISTAEDNFAPGTLLSVEGELQSTGIQQPASVTSLRIEGLNPAENYVYRVKALNSIGEGTYSNVVAVTMPPANFNRPPTLNDITTLGVAVAPLSGTYTVNLSGITDGGEGDQALTVTAVSSNPDAVSAPVVTDYNPATGTAKVLITPDGEEDSALTITVIVSDGQPVNNTISKSFVINVREAPGLLSFDDNNSDWNNEYTSTSTSSYGSSSWANNYGKANGGGIRISYTDAEPGYVSAWRNQPYNLDAKTYIETSILVKPSSWSEKEHRENLYLGFATNTAGSDALLYQGTAASLGALLSYHGESSPYLYVGFFNKATSSAAALLGSRASIASGNTLKNNWLQLKIKLIPSSTVANTYSAELTVHNLGNDGTGVADATTQVAFLTNTIANASIFSATEAYAGYTHRVVKDGKGSVYLDDHSVVVSAGVPTAPPVLPASIITSQTFTANWKAPSASSYDGYVLEVSTDESFAANTFVAANGTSGHAAGISLPRATTSLRFTNVMSSTNYWYRVVAYNEFGDSLPSSTVVVTTLAAGANALPTLNPISFPFTRLSPGQGPVNVNLTGITDGGEGNQPLSVTVNSTNPAVASATVSHQPNTSTGTVQVQGGAVEGDALISVVVSDGIDTFTQTFNVHVAAVPTKIGFDAPGDITSEITLGSNASLSSYNATKGTAGSGALVINDGGGEAAVNGWKNEVYRVPGAIALRTSVMVNFADITTEETKIGIGFVHSSELPVTNEKDWLKKKGIGQYISAHMKYERSKYELIIGNKTSAVDGNEAAQRESNTSRLTNWLRLSLELVPAQIGGSTFNATLRLEDMGPNGTATTPEVLQTLTASVTNAALGQSASTYAGFNLLGKKTNQNFYVDNHFAEVEFGTPEAPTATEASQVTAGTFSTHWTTPALYYATGFRLELSADNTFTTLLDNNGQPGGAEFTGIPVSGGNTRALRLSGLTAGNTYYYRVRGLNGILIGEPSNAIRVTLLPAGQNAQPTLSDLGPAIEVNNAGTHTFTVNGLSTGGEDESLTITASSSKPSLIPAPVWTVTTLAPATGINSSSLVSQPSIPGSTGTATFKFTPVLGQTGTAEITLVIHDGTHQVQKTLSVTVVAEEFLLAAGNATTGTLATGTEWKYSDVGDLGIGSVWKDAAFDDSRWKTGRATLGYRTGASNAGIATTLGYGSTASDKFVTSYFRKQFSVTHLSEMVSTTLRLRCNDGAVVYLNGVEFFRTSNMPQGDITYSARPTAAGNVGAAWITIPLNPTQFVAGNNVIAAEVHVLNGNSTDLIFDMELKASHLFDNEPDLPNPVTALPATHVTSNGFTAHWDAPARTTPAFLLDVSTTENFSTVDTVTITGANNREFRYMSSSKPVLPATTYYYRVRASNDATGTTSPNAVSLTTLAVGQNSRPTLDAIADVNVAVNAAATTIPLTGISTGGETNQWIENISVSSDTPSLFSSLGLSPAWDPWVFEANPTIGVRFIPTAGASGTANVTVTVKDDGVAPNTFSRTFKITVGTPPVGPRLAVLNMPGETVLTSPANVNFANTEVGQSSSRVIRLSNTGSASITGLTLNIAGVNASAFTRTNLGSATLAVGAHVDVTVNFTPQSAATLTATLSVTNTNAPSSPFVLNLSGTGTPVPLIPRLAVSLIPGNTSLTSPANLSFSNTVIGQTTPRTFRLSNTGNADVTGLALSLTGNDKSSFGFSNLTSTTLSPSAHVDVVINLTPSEEGALTAALQISSTNALTEPFVINLSGQGLPVPTGPSLAVLQLPEQTTLTSPADLSFAATSIGQSVTRSVRLSNIGSATAAGLALSLTGDDITSFTTTNVESPELAAGAHVDVTITFIPQAVEGLNATLQVSSTNALEAPFVIHLSGSGIASDQRDLRPVAVPVNVAESPNSEATGSWNSNIIGIYDGLLRNTVDHSHVVGAISKLTVSKPSGSATTGAASGTLLLEGRSIRLSGSFSTDGSLDLSTSGISILLAIEETGGPEGQVLVGTVTSNGQTAQVRLPKASTTQATAAAGLYTLLVPSQTGWGTTEPGGDGWATVSILSNGTVTMTGVLGDGTAFTETAYLSADGEFSIYVPLYAKSALKGSIGGTLKVRDLAGVSDFDGRLHWIKSANAKDTRYAGGFDIQPWAIGSRYTVPAVGQRSLASLANQNYNAIVSLIGIGSSASVEEKVVSWQSSNKVVYYGPDALSGAVTAKTGLLAGKYQDKPNKGSALNLRGVVFQKQGRAGGNFLHAQGSGALRIIPGTEYEYPGSETPISIPVAVAPETPAIPESTESIAWDIAATGAYTGVVSGTAGQQGALESLVITNKGAFTATLWIQGQRHQLKGTLDAEGNLQVASIQPAANGLALNLKLARTIAGQAKAFHITGNITSGTDTFTLSADRRPDFAGAERSPHEGIYTLAVLQGAESETPFGDGFASLKVSNKGISTGTLVLSDGSKTTFAGHVSVDGGWNFYRALYKNSGWIGGYITLRSTTVSDLDGTWSWVKKAGIAKTPAYVEGFHVSRQVTGSKFTKPARGERAFPALDNVFHNTRLHLTTSTSTSEYVSPLLESLFPAITWTSDNKLLYYGPEAVKISFNTSTGLLTGSYVDKAHNLKLTLGGALLQKQGLVTGFHATGVVKFGGLVLEPR